MKNPNVIVKDKEYRIYVDRKGSKWYVLGDRIRTKILTVVSGIVEDVKVFGLPDEFTEQDEDALFVMTLWFTEGRDLNSKQWVKYGKMLKMFNKPNTFLKLARKYNWKKGTNITLAEASDKTENKLNIAQCAASANYTSLFNE